MKLFDAFSVTLQGVHLIEASAGTGKTYNITSLYIRALIEKNLVPSQILVVTYTNDATAELKTRIRSRIIECIEIGQGKQISDPFLNWFRSQTNHAQIEHLKTALNQFDEAMISTIHGFCQRILSEYSLEFGVSPGFEILSDETELITEAADEFWREFFSSKNMVIGQEIRNFLQRSFSSPEDLLRKIKPAIEHTDIALSPDAPSLEEFESIQEILQQKSALLQEVLKEEKNELLTSLNKASLNNRSYYSSKYDRPEEFYEWIESGTCFDSSYEKLDLFTRDGIDKGFKKGFERPYHLRIFEIVEEWQAAFQAYSRIQITFLKTAISEIQERIETFKEQGNVLGYNDLLNLAKNGVQQSSGLAHLIKSRFPIALVDEFQDTDHIQYSLFRSVYYTSQKEALFLIGDPKQAIYRFRGADINTYLRAKNDVPEQNKHTLVYNFRSAEKVLAGVNGFFNKAEEPFKLQGLGFQNAEYPDTKDSQKGVLKLNGDEVAPLQCFEIDSESSSKSSFEKSIIQSIATEIVSLLNKPYSIEGKPITAGDIAILVSSHKQASSIQDTLIDRGIRSQIRSRASVFGSLQANELYTVLHAISNPFNHRLIRAALGTTLMGVSISDLQKMGESDEDWNQYQLQFTNLNAVWKDYGFIRCISDWMNEFNIEANLLSQKRSLRSITNLQHLIELLTKEARSGKSGQYHMLNHFRLKIENQSDSKAEDEYIRLESDDDLVRIMTMHASKGLEFPVVFCPFLWQHRVSPKSGFFPVSDGKCLELELDTSSEKYDEDYKRKLNEEFSEKLRLAYVALTRASSACYVYWTQEEISRNQNPISFLIDENGTRDSLGSDVAEWRTIEINNESIELESKNEGHSQVPKVFGRRNLSSFPRIHSFSSLSLNVPVEENEEKPGFDFDFTHVEEENLEVAKESIFTLPKGAVTGNLLHELFETIAFDKPETFSSAIDELTIKHGFEERWKPVLQILLENGVNHELISGINLGKISNENRLVEMQFHFPMKNVETTHLLSIIRNSTAKTTDKASGFMTGFIDLIFQYEGKFYILDYKSNHLGDSTAEYNSESLRDEMIHSSYDLQYHIYTVALHRYLKQRRPDYDYERDFGGVFYLFLRGIEKGKTGSGVYFDKPNLSSISRLDEYLAGGKHV